MSDKNRLGNECKRCGCSGSRGPFKKIPRDKPRKPYSKKYDRWRHFGLCLRAGI